jgi:hypothetical protein
MNQIYMKVIKIPKVVYELLQSKAKPKIELGLNLLLNEYKKK